MKRKSLKSEKRAEEVSSVLLPLVGCAVRARLYVDLALLLENLREALIARLAEYFACILLSKLQFLRSLQLGIV